MKKEESAATPNPNPEQSDAIDSWTQRKLDKKTARAFKSTSDSSNQTKPSVSTKPAPVNQDPVKMLDQAMSLIRKGKKKALSLLK